MKIYVKSDWQATVNMVYFHCTKYPYPRFSSAAVVCQGRDILPANLRFEV